MVKKWKRATRVGSPVMTGQINQNHAYVPSPSSYPTAQRSRQIGHSPSSAHTTRSSSDYVDSLTNGDVSTLASITYTTGRSQAPVRHHSNNHYHTPPSKEPTKHRSTSSRGDREAARRHHKEETRRHSGSQSARSPRTKDGYDDDNFLSYLENVQQQLSEGEFGDSTSSSRRLGWR